jgi:hypothetical protein
MKQLTWSLDRQNQQSLTACPMLRGFSAMEPSEAGSTSSSLPIICCPLSLHASATLACVSNWTCSQDAFFPRSCVGHLTAVCTYTVLVCTALQCCLQSNDHSSNCMHHASCMSDTSARIMLQSAQQHTSMPASQLNNSNITQARVCSVQATLSLSL